MLWEGVTSCTSCGGHFMSMEDLWMHELSGHPPADREVPAGAALPGARETSPPSGPESSRLDLGGELL